MLPRGEKTDAGGSRSEEPSADDPDRSGAAPEKETNGAQKLTNTQAMDSFNSLPESVRRMVMDADSEDKY